MTNTKKPKTAIEQTSEKSKTMSRLAIVLAVLVIGIIGRLGLTSLSTTRWGFWSDHFDNIGMGLTAEQHGLTRVYAVPLEDNLHVSGMRYNTRAKEMGYHSRKIPRVANYPPLGILLFQLQTQLLGTCDPSLEANTFQARLIMSISSVLAELITAAGIFMLIKELAGAKVGLIAASVCWLFPPLAMDSSLWGQTDAWPLAPAVWMMWLMLKRRWVLAGVCLSLACLLKPQGVLLGPIVLFAAITLNEAQARPQFQTILIRLGKTLGAAVLATLILTIPWIISDGFNWLEKSYIANFKMYKLTTLNAFNLWYLDVLHLDKSPFALSLDSHAKILGFSKDFWGKLLVTLAMVVIAKLCWRKYKSKEGLSLMVFAGLWLWSTFILPTQVHERYIVYCMPLLIAMAVVIKRLWPAILILAIIGSLELCRHVWLQVPAGALKPKLVKAIHGQMIKDYNRKMASVHPAMRPPPPSLLYAARVCLRGYIPSRKPYEPWEYTVTLLSLAGYAWAMIICLAGAPIAASKNKKRPP